MNFSFSSSYFCLRYWQTQYFVQMTILTTRYALRPILVFSINIWWWREFWRNVLNCIIVFVKEKRITVFLVELSLRFSTKFWIEFTQFPTKFFSQNSLLHLISLHVTNSCSPYFNILSELLRFARRIVFALSCHVSNRFHAFIFFIPNSNYFLNFKLTLSS